MPNIIYIVNSQINQEHDKNLTQWTFGILIHMVECMCTYVYSCELTRGVCVYIYIYIYIYICKGLNVSMWKYVTLWTPSIHG